MMCSPCALGSYAGSGQAECTPCPESFGTLAIGASTASQCTCMEGTFWNVRDDTCEPCKLEAFCPGGWHLPVVYAKSYGSYEGDVSSYEAAKQSKMAGTFKQADYADAFHTLKVYSCKSEAVCPGDEMSFSFPGATMGFAAEPVLTKKNVRVGFPLSGACPQNADASMDRTGVACDKCQEGYYGTGAECAKCSGGAQGGSAVLMLLVPVIMVCLYRGPPA